MRIDRHDILCRSGDLKWSEDRFALFGVGRNLFWRKDICVESLEIFGGFDRGLDVAVAVFVVLCVGDETGVLEGEVTVAVLDNSRQRSDRKSVV